MRVERLDHLVLTVTDLPATLNFYTQVCGMSPVVFADDRHGLTFGDQRINLHIWGSEFEPRAALATPGSADLCFLVDSTPEQVLARLAELEVPVEHGPVDKVGATGPIRSVYVRDPDGNLIELATPAVSARPGGAGAAGRDDVKGGIDGDVPTGRSGPRRSRPHPQG
ncbi:MAG TPA: VOC family protein [Mycobacteriales bacterium]|nr:VOC family protein [Mycobacteriales bacterium]